MKLHALKLTTALLILFILGSYASGQCVSDGNNSAIDADPIGFTDTVSDYVCPADTIDYYYFEVTSGQDVTGTISFTSPQVGTVFKVTATSGTLFEDDTTNSLNTLQASFSQGELTADTYYVRVSFWSNYSYDHQYTITMALTDGTNLILTPLPMSIKLGSPWPSPRGSMRNTGRTNHDGPGEDAFLVDSVMLNPMASASDESWRYHGLVIGKGNEAHYVDTATGEIKTYVPGNMRRLQSVNMIGGGPPRFDFSGSFFTIEPGKESVPIARLVCYEKFSGTETWRKSFPIAGPATLLAVGNLIYTKMTVIGGKVFVWDKSGDQVCELSLDSYVTGVVEDPGQNCCYIQTLEYLYKYDSTGNKIWEVKTGLSKPIGSSSKPKYLPPIVGYDSRVFIAGASKTQWIVYNPDGSIYKESPEPLLNPILGQDSVIVRAAAGSNGRFYVIVNSAMALTGLYCMEDWDQKVWSFEQPQYFVLWHDLILDANNRIYACFLAEDAEHNKTYQWVCLDPEDGSLIHRQEDAGIPEVLKNYDLKAELAIGEDNKLFLLHEGGFLGIYGGLKIAAGAAGSIGGITKQ